MAVTSLKRQRRRAKGWKANREIDSDLLWERPGDWPQLPEVLASDQKFCGLYKIENHDMNLATMQITCSTGTYRVDWGDGTVDAAVASGTVAFHTYDYASFSGAVTSEGFKCAVVTVTPNTGNITLLNLNQKHTGFGTNTGVTTGWLDMRMSLPSLTGSAANWGIGNGTVLHKACRQFEYIGTHSITSGSNMFVGMIALESLKVPRSFTSTFTQMLTMFSGCTRLRYIPDLDSSACTNFTSMFASCSMLRRVPALDYSHATTMSSVFQNCTSLEYIPDIGSIGVANTTSSMFAGCASLKNAPAITASTSLALTTNMFLNCVLLKSIPVFNTSFVTNMTSMFQGCSSLQVIPAFDFSAVNSAANFTNTFTSCNSVAKILATGARFGHTLQTQLSSAALDVYYTNLGTASGAQTLTVTGNSVATDTPSIATAKGWTVTGS